MPTVVESQPQVLAREKPSLTNADNGKDERDAGIAVGPVLLCARQQVGALDDDSHFFVATRGKGIRGGLRGPGLAHGEDSATAGGLTRQGGARRGVLCFRPGVNGIVAGMLAPDAAPPEARPTGTPEPGRGGGNSHDGGGAAYLPSMGWMASEAESRGDGEQSNESAGRAGRRFCCPPAASSTRPSYFGTTITRGNSGQHPLCRYLRGRARYFSGRWVCLVATPPLGADAGGCLGHDTTSRTSRSHRGSWPRRSRRVRVLGVIKPPRWRHIAEFGPGPDLASAYPVPALRRQQAAGTGAHLTGSHK